VPASMPAAARPTRPGYRPLRRREHFSSTDAQTPSSSAFTYQARMTKTARLAP
jgi:hypothetical protein